MIRVHPSHRGEKAFTILELMISISILSMMVVMNYKMIIGIIATKSEVDDKRESIYVANSVLARLTRELQAAGREPKLPPPCDDPSGQKTNFVLIGEGGGANSSGRGPTLTFSAKDAGQYVPDGGTHSGAVQISYRVEQDPEQQGDKTAGLLLVRDEIPNRQPYALSCKDAIRFPITNRLVKLEYLFFDKKTGEWLPDWTGPKAANLPDIIQFTLWLKSDKGHISSYTSAVKLNP